MNHVAAVEALTPSIAISTPRQSVHGAADLPSVAALQVTPARCQLIINEQANLMAGSMAEVEVLRRALMVVDPSNPLLTDRKSVEEARQHGVDLLLTPQGIAQVKSDEGNLAQFAMLQQAMGR